MLVVRMVSLIRVGMMMGGNNSQPRWDRSGRWLA